MELDCNGLPECTEKALSPGTTIPSSLKTQDNISSWLLSVEPDASSRTAPVGQVSTFHQSLLGNN